MTESNVFKRSHEVTECDGHHTLTKYLWNFGRLVESSRSGFLTAVSPLAERFEAPGGVLGPRIDGRLVAAISSSPGNGSSRPDLPRPGNGMVSEVMIAAP